MIKKTEIEIKKAVSEREDLKFRVLTIEIDLEIISKRLIKIKGSFR